MRVEATVSDDFSERRRACADMLRSSCTDEIEAKFVADRDNFHAYSLPYGYVDPTRLRIMDTIMFVALSTLCAPLVHPDTARAIVATESTFNPHAIGVVAGSLERQPRNVEEALATAQALLSQRREFSVGLAQISVHNLDRFGLSLADGFDSCKNLGAMQVVLTECFERAASNSTAQDDLRRALSCYYSGNFTTGFRHGYVNRVVSNAQKTARAPP